MDKNAFWKQHKYDIAYFEDETLNAAHNAVDKHKGSETENKTALIHESENGVVKTFTFGELSKLSNKFANILIAKGAVKGDRVFIFMPRIPELHIGFLGILKTGAIAGTLFSAFQKDALKDRLENSGAKILLTTKELYQRVEPIKSLLPNLRNVIIVDSLEFQQELATASDSFQVEHTSPEDYAFMLYTSGTTGKPKGVVHAHYAMLQEHLSAKLELDLKPTDIYWCTADPGWVTGIVYTILSNWSLGITTLIYEGRFDVDKWYELIQKHKVTVWYSAPTAVRMLMAKGDEIVKKYNLSSLRYLASVGEPLNPEAVIWSQKVFRIPFRDNWWQTETGSIMIANTPNLTIKPGSMGKPLPWVETAIVDDEGRIVEDGIEGNLVLKPPWPSMMRTIWKNKEKYDSYFEHGWYISGDRAKKDNDGYFWFVGRADDVIKTAGERVGPFEVESALVEHPSVVEAGVIGKPDQMRGEIIKAFVVLKPGVVPSEELKTELSEHVKKNLAGHAYPREIEFIDKLPKTRSGKIMRRILKAKELGQPIGDTSTLEEY